MQRTRLAKDLYETILQHGQQERDTCTLPIQVPNIVDLEVRVIAIRISLPQDQRRG